MIAAASHRPQVGHPLEDGGRRRVKGLLGDTTVTAVRNNFPFNYTCLSLDHLQIC